MQKTRRLLLILPVAMGLALVATALSGFLHQRAVRAALLRHQSDAILSMVRRQLFTRGRLNVESVKGFSEELRGEGVLCLAFFTCAGDAPALAAAGDCYATTVEMRRIVKESAASEVVDLGDRARIIRRRPSRREPGAVEQSPEICTLIEFEPRLIADLEAGAMRTLGIGGAASLALIVIALVAGRIWARADRLHAQLERDRRLAALGEMAAVLSHELRNPLTSMIGHTQLLAESLAEGGAPRAKADRVVSETIRMRDLTEDLLRFVRANRIERSDVDPAAILREAAETADAKAFILRTDGAPPRWPLDPNLVRQMLSNLLRNACQAAPEGRPAEATAAVVRDRLVYVVRDFGSGLQSGEAELVFEPFHTTRVRGTGLGLAVARRVAELHGGTISAENHPEGGAVFRVELPRG
ncbi:MAG: two-component sensor histidine kinase [Vicinamibacteria bacterium]|nr:two-component sensor histidine kinase [Vicinamibacteria bacterium]